MDAKVSINIVTWNSMEFLPDLLRSIFAQTYQNFEVLVIDNGSDDGVETFLREEYPKVKMLRNVKNLGFSPAHNQGIRFVLDHLESSKKDDRFILVTNPDLIMTETFLEKLMESVESRPDVGSFGGKLLRAYGENLADEVLRETVQSDRIDSTGLVAKKNRTFFDRGAGEIDRGQYDESRDVFGISGALVLLRASALEDARYNDEYFDHDFFAYKEDVDLAWRLRLLGWGSHYHPEAVAYHYRGMFGKEKSGLWEKIKNRRSKSRARSYYSNRNHWNMLTKNDLFVNKLIAAPWILTHEAARVLYVAIFEPSTFKAFGESLARTSTMRKKRRHTMKKRKVTAKEMRKWFV